MKNSITEFEKSISFVSTQYDNLMLKLDKMEVDTNLIRQENKNLKAEVLKTTNELKTLSEEFNNLEQYSRRDCLEVRGIPLQSGENTNTIVMDLGRMIGVELKEDDISVSHRLSATPTTSRDGNSRDPAIIVKFVRRDVRERFYKAKRELRDKTTKDMGFTRIAERKIFVIESLTQKNKELFKNGLKAKFDLHFKFIWTSSGKILLRKDKDSPARHISSIRDLERMIAAELSK